MVASSPSTSRMNQTRNDDRNMSYRSYVQARTQWNPCLKNLSKFLHDDTASQHPCHITSLEFSSASRAPSRRNLDLDSLVALLRRTAKEIDDICGRILIVEDSSSHVLETLGALLNIDPLFFASHIYTFQIDITTTRPSTVALPSTTRSQNFLNLHYHRVVEFEDLESSQVLHRDMNVPRKVKILPRPKGINIGLVRHCCSISKTQGRDGLWLGIRLHMENRDSINMETYRCIGLILVDPPISNSYVLKGSENQSPRTLTLQTRLFQGGFEDFLCGSSLSDNLDPDTSPPRSSPLESFIFYWGIKQPEGFDVTCPSLLSLSYYPLKMIAVEWMTYLELMFHSIKQYEYSPGNAQPAMGQIALLNADIYALQQWTRRCMATAHKIRYVIDFLRHRVTNEEEKECSALLTDDYKYIGSSIDAYSHHLGSLISIATSLIQAIDSRRSLTETINISRLGYLALGFIPLTFVSGLFSMNDNIAPGGKLFGLYFAVSIPLCIMIFLIVHPPTTTLADIAARIWGSKTIPNFAV